MRLNTLIRVFQLFALLFVGSAGAAEPEFTIYLTKYRTADELVRVAQPLFAGKANFSTMNEKVIINGPKTTTAEILKLFRELDRAPVRYRIMMRTVSRAINETEATAVEGGVSSPRGNVQKRSGVLQRRSGGSISVGGVGVSAESESSKENVSAEQTVEVLEGGEALLNSAGSSRSVSSSFLVKPRAAGQKAVHVELRQQEGKGDGFKLLNTSIDLPLKVWKTIGEVMQGNSGNTKEILGGSTRQEQSASLIQIRIDIEPMKSR